MPKESNALARRKERPKDGRLDHKNTLSRDNSLVVTKIIMV